jgi:sulfide dehydrogenase [flavocytochrome c] flavoprotein chain
VLDANPDIVAEKDNFTQAFMGLHASVVEYHTSVTIQSADSAAMALETSIGRIRADVINLIPAQHAGALVGLAGLNNANGGRFAGVDVLSYASTVSGAGKVHVIGDACGTNQPKSGHIANQEAKVCADAIVRAFAGLAPDPAPVTSSACYSTVTMRQAAWLSALFQYDPALRQMVSAPASAGASNGWSTDGFEEMGTWFRSLTSDTFA